jgi:hypothetical protein
MRRLVVPVALALILAGLPAPATKAAAFSVLVFSKVNGFAHESIPAGVAAIQQLGAANGFTVESTVDAATFTDANLARFKAVIFNNTNSRDGANNGGPVSVPAFEFGSTNCRPVTGDWDGNGTTTAGGACPVSGRWQWSLVNSLAAGSPSYPPFRFGMT